MKIYRLNKLYGKLFLSADEVFRDKYFNVLQPKSPYHVIWRLFDYFTLYHRDLRPNIRVELGSSMASIQSYHEDRK